MCSEATSGAGFPFARQEGGVEEEDKVQPSMR